MGSTFSPEISSRPLLFGVCQDLPFVQKVFAAVCRTSLNRKFLKIDMTDISGCLGARTVCNSVFKKGAAFLHCIPM